MNMSANPNAAVAAGQQQSQFNSPHLAVPNIQPAGFWIRAVALIIDQLIVSIVMLPINLAMQLGVPIIIETTGNTALGGVLSLAFLCVYLAAYAYYIGYFYTKKGATPGKLIFQIKVVNSENGTYCSFWQAVMRETIGRFLSTIIFGIGYIMVGFSPDKKALHDKLFNTQVLRKIG